MKSDKKKMHNLPVFVALICCGLSLQACPVGFHLTPDGDAEKPQMGLAEAGGEPAGEAGEIPAAGNSEARPASTEENQEKTKAGPELHAPSDKSRPGALFARELAGLESILQAKPYAPAETYYGERSGIVYPQVSHQLGTKSICVVTHSTLSMASYVDMSAHNHGQYAALHDYSFFHYRGQLTGKRFMNAAVQNPVHRYGFFWQKTEAVTKTLQLQAQDGTGPMCEWVMWVDGDTLFTDFSKSIESIVGRYFDKDIILAREETWGSANLINAGVFFVKNNEAGRAFIDGIRSLAPLYSDGSGWGDQDAVHHYTLGMPYPQTRGLTWNDVAHRVRADAVVTPAREFDGFYQADGIGTDAAGVWQPGDFLAHFAGMSGPARVESMRHVLSLLARQEGQS